MRSFIPVAKKEKERRRKMAFPLTLSFFFSLFRQLSYARVSKRRNLPFLRKNRKESDDSHDNVLNTNDDLGIWILLS